MTNFRSNVGDIISGKIKDIYDKNIGKARARDKALKHLGADNPAPAE